jgi:hypothetical protein
MIEDCGDSRRSIIEEENMKTAYKLFALTVTMAAFCTEAMREEEFPKGENIGDSQISSTQKIPDEIQKVLENPADADQGTRINALRTIGEGQFSVEHRQLLALMEQIVLGYDKEPENAETRKLLRHAAYYIFQQGPGSVAHEVTQKADDIFQQLGVYYGPGGEEK